jgi:hypothetical protein
MPRHHHWVYVIQLDQKVLEKPAFRVANPGYIESQPCVYVGMTGLDPDIRFDRHKSGIKANKFVRDFGERLMPELVDDLVQPMSYQDAKYLEVDTAVRLRELGFAVWQN